MRQLTNRKRSAFKDYCIATLALTPMFFVGYIILETSRFHMGNVTGTEVEVNQWLQSTLNLGWDAFNNSFVVLIALALIEFAARQDWKSFLRRSTLLGCVVSVGAFLLVANFVLIFTMLGDFRALHNTLTG